MPSIAFDEAVTVSMYSGGLHADSKINGPNRGPEFLGWKSARSITLWRAVACFDQTLVSFVSGLKLQQPHSVNCFPETNCSDWG